MLLCDWVDARRLWIDRKIYCITVSYYTRIYGEYDNPRLYGKTADVIKKKVYSWSDVAETLTPWPTDDDCCLLVTLVAGSVVPSIVVSVARNVARNSLYKKAFSKTPTINRITNDCGAAATPHWCVTASSCSGRAALGIVKYIFFSNSHYPGVLQNGGCWNES